ncbi:MAG TPA: iron uptake system protein EfeO [Solirubrobacterales bacterium]|jgi:iron uptake system component EfeO|nr:iron uptake system protein EfeO [Solirubrobacterales bacterium]
MNRVPVRALIAAAALGLLALLVAACGSSDKAPAGSKQLSFTLTEEGCSPTEASATAGPIEFKVENEGSSKYTELEVLDGETVLGERENVIEGASGTFALTLEEGEYTVRCQEASGEGEGTLKVTGELKTTKSPEIETAIDGYKEYLLENSEELTKNTKPFVQAVIAGNIAEAKKIYPTPRINYERIEPVAESFGDLDPRIDARENDVPKSEFGGFHRIEKALWEEDTTKGMKPVAEGLREDVEELEEKIKGDIKIQAVEIANGANELLTEVSTSKITGEEERYSHIDLVDFLGNVEGSQVAFEAVAPLIEKKQPKLVKEVEADYEAVYAALKPYETTKWPGFVLYTELNKSDTRKLAQVIDTLADKSAMIPAQIAKGEAE